MYLLIYNLLTCYSTNIFTVFTCLPTVRAMTTNKQKSKKKVIIHFYHLTLSHKIKV